jgi:hypothetical protein
MKRRDFLTRATILLGSVGIAESFKLDLMHKIGRSILPSAAADTVAPQRVLEICFRSGIPLVQFATGSEIGTLTSPKYANYAYSNSQTTKANSNMYFNMDSASLVRHAANIAITQGIESDGSHTDQFNIRMGATGQNLVAPIVELASSNTTSSLIYGVQWPGDVINSTGTFKDLVQVTSGTGFTGLFKNNRLQMTGTELTSVLDAASQLSSKQASILETKLANSASQNGSIGNAVALFSTDYSSLLTANVAKMATPLTDMSNPGSMTTNYNASRNAMALSLAGFQYNLINSSQVIMELGDWHPLQDTGNTAPYTKAVSDTIAAAVDFLKVTPDPASTTGQMLWDTTVIMASSEFNRGLSQIAPSGMAIDNNDGDNQGMMLIGKNIKGNYYGGFDVSGLSSTTSMPNAVALGFDNNSGSTTPGMKNTTLQGYYTMRKALGLTNQITQNQVAFNVMFNS